MDEFNFAKRRKCEDKDGGNVYYQSNSTYDIKSALIHDNIPLSDNIHGPFIMFPPELLHTSGSGLIMYMLESLCNIKNWMSRKIPYSILHDRFSILYDFGAM